MNNEILENALNQLKSVGIEPKVWKGGKHTRIAWEHKGQYRAHTVPISPSDHRAAMNNRAQLRRILREDGLLPTTLPVIDTVLTPPNVPQVIETPRLWLEDGHVVAGSLDIATHFGKPHKDVLRSIDRIMGEVDPEFAQRNFAPSTYHDASGKANRCFKLTRDGLSVLAMGFTGSNAMKWKLAYIRAFNEMEGQLLKVATPPELLKKVATLEADLAAMMDLVGELQANQQKRLEHQTKAKSRGPQVWQQRQVARKLRKLFAA